MRIKNLLKIDFIKTIFFNLKYLPLKQSIRLPIYIYRGVRFNRLKGYIQLNASTVYHGMIKIGKVIMGNADPKYQRAILEIDGTIVFNGKATIGLGTKVSVKEHASLFLGDNIWIENLKSKKNITKLTREIVIELIDCIYVHESGDITIRFKFTDEYERILEYIKMNEELTLVPQAI